MATLKLTKMYFKTLKMQEKVW